jgi:1-deoxy-D-xylulose-5-phosphate reductoisomerase
MTEQAQTAEVPAQRSVSILGATGSIGSSTIDLLKRHRGKFCVEAVAAGNNVAALAAIACELGARFAAVADQAAYLQLREALSGTGIEVAAGSQAIVEAAQRPADWVMAAIAGSTGLKATLAAVERGKTVALANKECLVCAGALFMRHATAAGTTVLPVDSEHNAVFQALAAGRRQDVLRVVLTASGGPFRTWSKAALNAATPEQALRHPNWAMGPKVTIDSATLMNKGLELIEAHHLFDLAPDLLEVVVHPQSVVHGLVEFRDGSVVAQLGPPDMRIPIAHCLAWPARLDGPVPRLNLAKVGSLNFEAPDLERFPALGLARRALEAGGGAPTVLNAANEVAVAAFIAGQLGYVEIAPLVGATLEAAELRGLLDDPSSVEEALAIDQGARSLAQGLLPRIAAKAS